MRPGRDLQHLVLQHIHELEEQWRNVRDGDADAIHQARVTTRRIRAALPLIPRVSPAIVDTFRRIGRQLGRVRELDATREVLAELHSRVDVAPEAVAVLTQKLERDRRAKRRRMIKALDDIDVFKLGQAIAKTSHGMGRLTYWWHSSGTALAEELRRRAANVEREIERASGVFMPKRTHRVRVAVKKLRYAVEAGVETGITPDSPSLAELKSVQGILGRLHDLCVLQKVVGGAALEGDGRAHDRVVLESIVAGESSRLHAKYLRRRDRVIEACHASTQLVHGNRHSVVRLVGTTAAMSVALWDFQRRQEPADDAERAVLPATLDERPEPTEIVPAKRIAAR